MPSQNKIKIPINGMHCKSCEILIEEELKQLPGAINVMVDHKRGEATVTYGKTRPENQAISAAISKAGYEVGADREEKRFFSRNKSDYKELGVAFLFLLAIYYLAKNFGLIGLDIGDASNNLTVPLIFLVGLTAGVSTCMALVGGLVLGLSAKHNEAHPEASGLEKFRPHLFFNLGRISSYAFFGGLLGLVGSAFQFSAYSLGLITIAVGIIMLIMGLQLINIFPWVKNFRLALPKGFGRILGVSRHQREYSRRGSFALGAATFFLPCGFTQAMQIYAIGTGSFAGGVIVMSVFALGTMPGLLGIGGLASFIKGAFARKFFKFAGLAVIAFAIFNISNGLGLAGLTQIWGETGNANINDPNVTLVNGVQIVKMTEVARGYEPNSFTIRKDVPVSWEIDAQAPFSCAASLILPKHNISRRLVSGLNIIEFTPTEAGRLPFSCSMGMYTGAFNVVDEKGGGVAVDSQQKETPAVAGGLCNGSGCGTDGGGCGCGGRNIDAKKNQAGDNTVTCH